MGDFANITLNGKPLSEVLRQQRLTEVERHFASEQAEVRRQLSHRSSAPVALAPQKRGRKPIEVRSMTMLMVEDLALADESLSIEEIAREANQPVNIIRLCLRRRGIKRKGGRKKKIAPAQQ